MQCRWLISYFFSNKSVKGIIDPTILEPDNWNGTLYSKYIEEGIDWTPENREEYQNLIRYGPHKAYCIPFTKTDSFMEIQYPQVKNKYQVASTCNSNAVKSRKIDTTGVPERNDGFSSKLVSFRGIVLIIILLAIVTWIYILIKKKLSDNKKLETIESVVLLKPISNKIMNE